MTMNIQATPSPDAQIACNPANGCSKHEAVAGFICFKE